jgi:hypothetical protein
MFIGVVRALFDGKGGATQQQQAVMHFLPYAQQLDNLQLDTNGREAVHTLQWSGS